MCVCLCVFGRGLRGQQRLRLSVCLGVYEMLGVRGRVQLEKRGGKHA